jgi:hypothetical protein
MTLKFNTLTPAQHADIIAGLHVDVTKWGTHLRDMIRVAADLSATHGSDVATGMIALAAMGMEDDLTYGAFAAALVALATTADVPAEGIAELEERHDRGAVRRHNLTRERDTARTERDAAYREVQHLREVTADLQRRADSTRKWLAAQREAESKPRAHQSRPLTPEEQASSDRGEAGVWPAWIQPCDPIVSVAEDTVTIGCAETLGVIVQASGSASWSGIVAQVAAHRCGHGDVS